MQVSVSLMSPTDIAKQGCRADAWKIGVEKPAAVRIKLWTTSHGT